MKAQPAHHGFMLWSLHSIGAACDKYLPSLLPSAGVSSRRFLKRNKYLVVMRMSATVHFGCCGLGDLFRLTEVSHC